MEGSAVRYPDRSPLREQSVGSGGCANGCFWSPVKQCHNALDSGSNATRYNANDPAQVTPPTSLNRALFARTAPEPALPPQQPDQVKRSRGFSGETLRRFGV